MEPTNIDNETPSSDTSSSVPRSTMFFHLPLRSFSKRLAPNVNYSFKDTSATGSVICWLSSFALDNKYRSLFFSETDNIPSLEEFSIKNCQMRNANDSLDEYTGKPCGYVYKPGDAVYRCKDCGLDDTCCLCARCFDPAQHEGHDISVSIHNGGCGCCDCGDDEAWKRPLTCRLHTPRNDDSAPNSSETPAKAESTIVPDGLEDEISQKFKAALEFVSDVLTSLPLENTPVKSEDEIKAQLSPMDIEAGRSSGLGPWSSVLWNDEKHNFQQVIEIVKRALPSTSHDEAQQIAFRVDSQGYEILQISHDTALLDRISTTLSRIDLCVTTRPAQHVFDHLVAGTIIAGLRDLMQTKFGNDANFFPKLVADALFSCPEGSTKTHMETLLLSDIKLWKQAREDLRELLVLMLSVNHDFKIQLGSVYASAYPELVNHNFLVDREPEYSVLHFGVQIFTVPSVSAHVVQNHNMLSQMINILYAIFTDQVDSSRKRYILPPSHHRTGALDSEAASLRNRRPLHLFQDMIHLIATNTVQKIICQDPKYLDEFTHFLSLFAEINLIQRAVDQHVEYEQETWATVFNVMIQISRACHYFGECYHEANASQLSKALYTIIQYVRMQAFGTHYDSNRPGRPDALLPIPYDIQKSSFGPYQRKVIKFDVASEPVSFHHPHHWLAAEVMKSAICNVDPAEIKSQLNNDFVNKPIHFYEAPLRVMALLSQIRSGLWVRNGLAMRAQLLHYREFNLRSNTFDKEIFFLQTGIPMVLNSEYDLFFSLVDRFGLTVWLQNGADVAYSPYDEQQAFSMIEELLYLIIILISEPTDIYAWNIQNRIKREVIHALCIGQCTHSEIIKRVSERVEDEPDLDRILKNVASYHSPDASANDQGYYKLLDEYYEEVDPYYYRFTRNQREEAINVLHKRLKSPSNPEPIIIPKPLPEQVEDDNPSLYKFIQDFINAAYTTPILPYIAFSALLRSTRATNSTYFSESSIDMSLHIMMRCLVQKPEYFALEAQIERPWNDGQPFISIASVLCDLEDDDRVKSLKGKIVWCLDTLEKYIGEYIYTKRAKYQKDRVESVTGDVDKGDEAKDKEDDKEKEKNRSLAKSRQDAIMKSFSAAQKNFAQMYDIYGVEEEEDDDATVSGREIYGSCIVCQEELEASDSFGSLAMVQSSRLIHAEVSELTHVQETLSSPINLDHDMNQIRKDRMQTYTGQDTFKRNRLPKRHKNGLFATACGHMMHTRCHETYIRSVQNRHSNQATRNHPENLARKEFLCPLCKSLGNLLIPVVPREDDNIITTLPSMDNNNNNASGDAQTIGSLHDWVNDTTQRLAVHFVQSDDSRMEAWKIDDSRITRNQPSNAKDAKIVADLMQILWPLRKENFDDHPPRYFPDDVLAYTIACIEIAQRGSSNTDFTSNQAFASCPLNETNERLLKSLFLCMRKLLKGSYPSSMEHARLDVLTPLITNRAVHKDHAPFLLCDPLVSVCEVASVSPCDLEKVVGIGFYSQLMRTFLSIPSILARIDLEHISTMYEFNITSSNDVIDEQEFIDLARLATVTWAELLPVSTKRPWKKVFDTLGERCLGKLLYSYTLPYLRRAEIVVLLRGGDYSTMIRQRKEEEEENNDLWFTLSEFKRLIKGLGIPEPSQVLGASNEHFGGDAEVLRSLMRTWYTRAQEYCSFFTVTSGRKSNVTSRIAPQIEHVDIYELVPLPHKLDDLLLVCQGKTCKNCGRSPMEPAICLLCGEFVCHQSYCCVQPDFEPMFGECNTHMWSCGGTVGIYFLVKKCILLYLYTTQGTFSAPPYLDQHGEIDIGMRRHLRQYLHWPRYESVRKQWVNQTIPTFVARKLEAMMDSGGWATV